jgi:AraC-like DNA-binding protein
MTVSQAISLRDRKGHRGTIAIHFVRAVVAAVRARGVDAEALLRAAGIAPGLLQVAQARVSARDYSALWRLVIERLDDEFFGQDSRRMKSGSFALLCHSVVHCTTLRAALARAARFYGILLDDVTVEIAEMGAGACIRLRQARAARPAVFAHETLLVMLHGLACWLIGRRIPILAAEFAYAEPAHAAEYMALFGPTLRYGRAHTAIEFDAALLGLPVVQDERSVKEFLRAAPENILLKYKNTQGLAARIRRRLRQVLPAPLPELGTLAREFHLAPATLRRRLQAEGQSYQAIKDELRRDLAISYLGSTTLSVAAIAAELGFLEPSAFHRAFRRWTHASPSAYREAVPGRRGARPTTPTTTATSAKAAPVAKATR